MLCANRCNIKAGTLSSHMFGSSGRACSQVLELSRVAIFLLQRAPNLRCWVPVRMYLQASNLDGIWISCPKIRKDSVNCCFQESHYSSFNPFPGQWTFFQQTKKLGLVMLHVLCFPFSKYLVSVQLVHLLSPVLICI